MQKYKKLFAMLVDEDLENILNNFKKVTNYSKAKMIQEVFYYFNSKGFITFLRILEEMKENEN